MVKRMLLKGFQAYVQRPVASVSFSWPVWRFMNRAPRALFRKNPPQLSSVQERMVRELSEEGIALTSFNELFGSDQTIFNTITSQLDTLVNHALPDPKKEHFKMLWDTRAFHLDPHSGFAQFALSPVVVNIANAYLGMWSRLLLCNGYISEPRKGDSGKVLTQNWHRDRHDKQLMCAFVYLTDVETPQDGAFWFVKHTHAKGKLRDVFPQPKPFSKKKFPSDEELIEKHIPQEYKVCCLGKKGTIIFADATGIHRGGHSTRSTRIMALTAYASQHRFSKNNRLSYPENKEAFARQLAPEVRYSAQLK